METSKAQEHYWSFFLDGRDHRVLRHATDVPALVAKLKSGDGVRAPAMAAALEVVRAVSPVHKGKWLKENQAEIASLGVDPDRAFAAWMAGRSDKLAAVIEKAVLRALDDDDEGAPDDDDGDGDDDDQNDDDGET